MPWQLQRDLVGTNEAERDLLSRRASQLADWRHGRDRSGPRHRLLSAVRAVLRLAPRSIEGSATESTEARQRLEAHAPRRGFST
jgi:hypothetical protein